jgi:hypothetical protein
MHATIVSPNSEKFETSHCSHPGVISEIPCRPDHRRLARVHDTSPVAAGDPHRGPSQVQGPPQSGPGGPARILAELRKCLRTMYVGTITRIFGKRHRPPGGKRAAMGRTLPFVYCPTNDVFGWIPDLRPAALRRQNCADPRTSHPRPGTETFDPKRQSAHIGGEVGG